MITHARFLPLLASLTLGLALTESAHADTPLTEITAYEDGFAPQVVYGPAAVPAGMKGNFSIVNALPALTPVELVVELDDDGQPDAFSTVTFVIAIENGGKVPIDIYRVNSLLEDRHWVVPTFTPQRLAPGQVLLVKVVFAPKAAGEYKGIFDVWAGWRRNYESTRARFPGLARVRTHDWIEVPDGAQRQP